MNEHESVITGEATLRGDNKELLKAMNEGRENEFIYHKFVIPELNKEHLKGLTEKREQMDKNEMMQMFDDYELRRKFEKMIYHSDRNTDRIVDTLNKRRFRF